jgi:polyribonucleotide nucleotidyltransferase
MRVVDQATGADISDQVGPKGGDRGGDREGGREGGRERGDRGERRPREQDTKTA